MIYDEAIKFLYDSLPMFQRIGKQAYKADLSNSNMLDAYFGYPHKNYPCIHVAGTNGKGSVCHMLASVLQKAGYKTGLFTSPHLIDFRERIRVNGEMISKEYVTKFTTENKKKFEETSVSFFEMNTFMAFQYFKDCHVDIAIIETGLGGRLDSTNVVRPILSVITNIGMDHTQFLGSTVKEIAGEKAGIIKKRVPVLIGHAASEINEVFIAKAEREEAPIYFTEEYVETAYTMQQLNRKVAYHLRYKNLDFSFDRLGSDLIGKYQERNIPIALKSIDLLRQEGFKINDQDILDGMENIIHTTGLKGRWQEVSYNPLVICDAAHNTEGFDEILTHLANMAYKSLHMVLGFVSDKDVSALLKKLPKEAVYYFCEPDLPRAMEVSKVAVLAKNSGLEYSCFKTVGEAFAHSKENAEAEDLIYIGGSIFVVADFLKHKSESKQDANSIK